MPPTLPTLSRGAIKPGIDQPTEAAADRPPIDKLIQNSAHAVEAAKAAPRIPTPSVVPPIRTNCRTLTEFRPACTRASTSQPPTSSSTQVAKSHGTPVYRDECEGSRCIDEEK